jgi:hypothetical protein
LSDPAAYPALEIGLCIGTWDVVDWALPDTGYDGGAVIPVGAGREVLAEPYVRDLRLADRSTIEVPAWRGTIDLEGHTFDAEIVAVGDRYLIGRDIRDQLEICFEFGQRVRLRFHGE